MFYRCDPRKNHKCRKTTCYINNGNCSLTTDMNCKCEGTDDLYKKDTLGNKITAQQAAIAKEMKNGELN